MTNFPSKSTQLFLRTKLPTLFTYYLQHKIHFPRQNPKDGTPFLNLSYLLHHFCPKSLQGIFKGGEHLQNLPLIIKVLFKSLL
ncbi:hypothetical protein MKW98_018281 [Papaver atlanticum]|uniref:Uncharacterized protein n=1 Tax=Papaver atlanticum TaxID=357466 RepID=A0AAD4SIA1_9MAGN|nr:hypothetical protein MKW98_018281 [Papaver atlanticum]